MNPEKTLQVRSVLQYAKKKGAGCGLQKQSDELAAAHAQITANIDWLAGGRRSYTTSGERLLR